MKLTCRCGSELEVSDEAAATPYRMDKFLDAHAVCLQPEVHNRQHFNLDSNFWLNTFAGVAMQGLLSNPNYTYMLEQNPAVDEFTVKDVVAANAICYAKAMLKELEK